MHKERLLESYKKGWNEIYKLCKFETTMQTETRVIRFGKYEFTVHAGMHTLDVDDTTLAKWFTVSRMISESGRISGIELLAIIAELGAEDGKKN